MMEHQQYFKFDIELPQQQVVDNVYGQLVGKQSCAVTYVESYTNDLGRNVVLIGAVCVVRYQKGTPMVGTTLKIIETTTTTAEVIVTMRSLAPRALKEYEVELVYPRIKHYCHEPYSNPVTSFFERIFGTRKEKRK